MARPPTWCATRSATISWKPELGGETPGQTIEGLEGRLERLDRISELIAAIILSIAALASSFAGFQAALWDGEQAANYTLAEQSRTAASRDAMISAQMQTLDVMLFTQWLNAYSGGDRRLQLFYRSRFRPQFHRAFEEWLRTRPMRNPRAPLSPIMLPSYAKDIDRDSKRLELEASRHFAEGARANDISDAFVQSTVILALALFMGGIVQAFNALWLRATLLGVATISVALGLARIISLPALRLTL